MSECETGCSDFENSNNDLTCEPTSDIRHSAHHYSPQNSSASFVSTSQSPSDVNSERSCDHSCYGLLPEQIRWLYRDTARHKKWLPFIGYDSLRLECKYQEARASLAAGCDVSASELVTVRGGLYEVDVLSKKCSPIYWSTKDDVYDVIRGSWFTDGNWQPIEEEFADKIEKEHVSLQMKLAVQADYIQPSKTSLHEIEISQCCVEWRNIDTVYFYRQSSPSKIYRAFNRTFRFTHGSGILLRRGYCQEAAMTDKPVDITRLVFVIHGSGQRMYAGSILKCCADLRESCQKMMKHLTDFDITSNHAEFIPVEWRSALTLDGDTVESITPNKVRDVRTFLNGSAMDVLYYTSPLYRNEIVSCLRNELNRLYRLFTLKNPYFEANGGKVSVVAHSLGAVIVYDIVVGWSCIDPQAFDGKLDTCEPADDCNNCNDNESNLRAELHYQLLLARQRFCYYLNVFPALVLELACLSKLSCSDYKTMERVRQLEMQLDATNGDTIGARQSLSFKLDCFFTLGSPLAVFLALRGVRPSFSARNQDHILSTSLCRRLFNIFHPSDPIAYRVEPLILKEYSGIKPLRIYRYDASKKEPYDEMTPSQYMENAVNPKNASKGADSDASSEPEMASSADSCDSAEKSVGELSEMFCTQLSATSSNSDESTDAKLEHRLDYMLKERAMESAYLATLTSHTAYWTNLDVAMFILTHIFGEASSAALDNGGH